MLNIETLGNSISNGSISTPEHISSDSYIKSALPPQPEVNSDPIVLNSAAQSSNNQGSIPLPVKETVSSLPNGSNLKESIKADLPTSVQQRRPSFDKIPSFHIPGEI